LEFPFAEAGSSIVDGLSVESTFGRIAGAEREPETVSHDIVGQILVRLGKMRMHSRWLCRGLRRLDY